MKELCLRNLVKILVINREISIHSGSIPKYVFDSDYGFSETFEFFDNPKNFDPETGEDFT